VIPFSAAEPLGVVMARAQRAARAPVLQNAEALREQEPLEAVAQNLVVVGTTAEALIVRSELRSGQAPCAGAALPHPAPSGRDVTACAQS